MNRTQKKNPENTEKKLEDTRFKKGQSGNPKGRPKGSLNKTTLAAQALLDDEAENITRKAIELAQGGDTTAIKLCFDRILPVKKDRPVSLSLPAINSPKDSILAMASILKAVCSGEITPREGERVSNMVENNNKCFESQELVERIARLETQNDYEKELY